MKEIVKVPIHFKYTGMMFEPSELPFDLSQLPNVYSQFRTMVERGCEVKPPKELPEPFKPLVQDLKTDHGPPLGSDLNEYGKYMYDTERSLHPTTAFPFQGGEQSGLQRIQTYFWDTHNAKNYKETRNGLLGEAYSTKFSPWLAVGALSPRMIMHKLSQYEKVNGSNDSTYWIWFELLYVL